MSVAFNHNQYNAGILTIYSHTECLHKTTVMPPAGSVRDSYDNALTETINDFYKMKAYSFKRA